MSVSSEDQGKDLIQLVKKNLEAVGFTVEGDVRVARKEGLEQYVQFETVASLFKASAVGEYAIEAWDVRVDGVEDYPFWIWYILIEAVWRDSECTVYVRTGREEIVSDDLSGLSARFDRIYEKVNTAVQKLDEGFRRTRGI